MQWQRIFDPFGLGEQVGLYGKGPKNPAEAAMPYLDKIPGMLQQQFGPYQQQGQNSYGQIQGPLNSMTTDPAGYLENLSKGYEQSPGFQFRRDEALRGASNSAAAGGFAGTLGDRRSEAGIADAMAGEDFQNWLQNALKVQGMGLAGNQNIYGQGYDATKNYAGDLSNLWGTQAGFQFQGQREQNKGKEDQMKALMQMLMSIVPKML